VQLIAHLGSIEAWYFFKSLIRLALFARRVRKVWQPACKNLFPQWGLNAMFRGQMTVVASPSRPAESGL
jgi:hypothetical protein